MIQIQPINQAYKLGAYKVVLFGPPGTAKTPKLCELHNSLTIFIENGIASARASGNHCIRAHNITDVREAFAWLLGSNEVTIYDHIGIDSISHYANLVLEDALTKTKHGMQAYGAMADEVLRTLNRIEQHEKNNIIMTAKEGFLQKKEVGANGIITDILVSTPRFPGQVLELELPHLFDGIWYVNYTQVPGIAGEQLAVRTQRTSTISCRDRSRNLRPLEPFDLNSMLQRIHQ